MLIRLNLVAFHSRDFRLYFLGNAFTLQALWIQRITIGWIAWELSGAASVVGWIAFLIFAPTMISGPFFGVLVDRMPIRPAAIRAQAGLSLISLAMALLFAGGLLTLPLLSGLALAIGVVTSANHPVRMSLAPLLVPEQALTSLITATAINFNVARSIGPAIGGAIIAHWGVGAALWVIFACSLPYQIALRFLRPRARAANAEIDQGVWDGLRQGVAHAWRSPLIRSILTLTATFALVGRGMIEILPLIADGLFARGATGLGNLTSAAGIGALVGTALVAVLPPPRSGVVPLAGRFAALSGLPLGLCIALSPWWSLTVLAVALMGLAGTIVGVSMQSAVQQVLTDDLRGRVMSLWVMTGIGGAATGALLLGALADLMGLASGTLLMATAAGLLFAWIHHQRGT